jgi:predicted RNA-binding Zn ribbon-like protein
MDQAGTIRTSDLKDGFLFVGNQLALDFVNTRPVQNGEPMELLPDFPALLRWFQAASLLTSREVANLNQQWGQSIRARHVLEAMRALRERLRKEILSWEGGGAVYHSTVDELNRLMAEHPMRTRLKEKGHAPSTELWFEPHEPEDLFAPLAHSAAMLFANVDRNRVRKCDQCVLHFHDISKKGTRRWCSMQLCGNRLKVAAYAARRRLHADERQDDQTQD